MSQVLAGQSLAMCPCIPQILHADLIGQSLPTCPTLPHRSQLPDMQLQLVMVPPGKPGKSWGPDTSGPRGRVDEQADLERTSERGGRAHLKNFTTCCEETLGLLLGVGVMMRGVTGRALKARMLNGLAPFLLLLVAMIPVGERVDALSFPKPGAPGGGMPADAKSGDDANALFIEGNVLLQDGDLPNAVLKYRAALEADPEHADAWTNSE